jgi:translation elongation factor EF-Tu-like GTPase
MEGETFELSIDDVFVLAGRGTVVWGPIESGVLRSGERVKIVEGDRVVATATAQIEMINKRGADPRTIGLLLQELNGAPPAPGQRVRRERRE